ncbi:hypothetical protein FHT87_005182 [Rhizobium sp. BK316]|uniref:hypothetical protein n=1 Tax=Rhizobium sp. BK316 TaxID=2587053 RepID=UPI00161FD895|nr:hypothetical protein [Rhizobium sp. BK316]MBB3411229.1 hypothetical protein [Rhizobium sp. BK316]
MPAVGETRAVVTLQRICRRYGEDHGRFLVMTLAETANNKSALTETTLWAVSDMIRATNENFPDLIENNVESWFKFWDALPLGWLEHWCLDLDGIIPKRYALSGMIYERLKRQFGGLAKQPDLLDDRRRGAA